VLKNSGFRCFFAAHGRSTAAASARRAQARHPAPDRHRRLGGCGAASRKDARHVRDISRADRLRFRLASMPADMPRQVVREAVRIPAR
jgi:hypothetical protein